MEVSEIIGLSGEPNCIYIVKEALFCKVYEESAWRFHAFIRPFKPVKKFVKKYRKDIVTIGFPKSNLESILKTASENGCKIAGESDATISLITDKEPDCPFDEWKEQLCAFESLKAIVEEPLIQMAEKRDIEWEIAHFPVANHTPMQCMEFIIHLQSKIKR